MNPRPYQSTSVELVRELYKSGKKKVIACLPTGSGKTVLFAYLTKITLDKSNKSRVLILTDRKELLNQAGKTLSGFNIPSGQIKSGKHINLSERCHVAMVETYLRRIDKHPELLDYNLIIIDEAHRGVFARVMSHVKESSFVLGTTATPLSSNKKFPLKNYYDDIVCPIGIDELIKQKYLVPAVTYSLKIDRSELKKQGGEFTDASLMKTYDKRVVYEGLISRWKKYANGMKTICFCVNIEHSIKVRDQFRESGISSEHVDGSTPDQHRSEILERFKKGEFLVLVNVGIVTTGYDEPSVECIIVNSAMTSIPLWLQKCGRGSRLFPGKKSFIILDMGENYKHLGLWEQDRDWDGIFFEPKKINEGIAPVKKCPNCEAIIRASIMLCPYCHHEITPKQQELIDKEAEFERIQLLPKTKEEKTPLPRPDRREWKSLQVEQLCALVKSGTYKPQWAVRVIKERNIGTDAQRNEIKAFTEKMGYKPTWVNWAMRL